MPPEQILSVIRYFFNSYIVCFFIFKTKKIYIDPFLDNKGFLLHGHEFLQFLTLISYSLILLFGGTFIIGRYFAYDPTVPKAVNSINGVLVFSKGKVGKLHWFLTPSTIACMELGNRFMLNWTKDFLRSNTYIWICSNLNLIEIRSFGPLPLIAY